METRRLLTPFQGGGNADCDLDQAGNPDPEELALITRCQSCGRRWPLDSASRGGPTCGAGD